MKINVKLSGNFDAGELRRMREKLPEVVKKATLAFAQEAVDKLKADIWANKVVPAKKRDNGRPTLIDSAKYVNGFRARQTGRTAVVEIIGSNDNMSNAALLGLLEYGGQGQPARPHIRPLGVWIRSVYAKKVGDRIAKELLNVAAGGS